MLRRIAVTLTLLVATTAFADDLYVAFWNVENLFDTVDDPAVAKDEEFTPDAPKLWTDERFNTKLKNLARVIRDMNGARGPDVLGLSEVENRFVIEKLIEQLAPLERDYRIVHKDSPSNRGIDCALIYDRKVVKLKSSGFIHVPAGKTRDIVAAELTVNGDSLFVFVNHWPSRGGDRTGAMRAIAAKKLRGRIDAILASKRDADILVIGDLNDFPADPSVREHLGAAGKADSLKPRALFNSTAKIHDAPGQGSYNYRGQWEVIDHAILSSGLLDNRGFSWKRGSTVVIRNDYQLYRAGTPEARPNRTYGGNRYYGGYSDHLPIACVVQHREARSRGGNQRKFDIARTRALILSGIKGTLDMYRMHIGRYPTTEEGLLALVRAPDGEEFAMKWRGPYLKDRSGYQDAWGSELIYESPGQFNEATYDLSSAGPDGMFETDDDVTNWR